MNLTPTQKADELIERLLKIEIDFPYNDTEDGQCIGSGYMTYKSAVKIAIKAVDEILEATANWKLEWKPNTMERVKGYSIFWQEVKQILTDRL